MREAPAADPSGFDKAGDPASNGTASPRAAAGPLHRLAQEASVLSTGRSVRVELEAMVAVARAGLT